MKQFMKAAQHFSLDTSALGVQVKLFATEFERPNVSTSPVARLNALLDTFMAQLPHSTLWRQMCKPVFIIDEANELEALKKDPYGNDALHNIFKWLIMNTNEYKKFKVILESSDSFVHLWVLNYVVTSRF